MNKVVLVPIVVAAFIATHQYFTADESGIGTVANKNAPLAQTDSSQQNPVVQSVNVTSSQESQACVTQSSVDDSQFCSADTLACPFESSPEPLIVGEYVAVDDLTNLPSSAEPMSVGEYIPMDQLSLIESGDELIVGEFYDINDYLNEPKDPMSVGEEISVDAWISQREYSQD